MKKNVQKLLSPSLTFSFFLQLCRRQCVVYRHFCSLGFACSHTCITLLLLYVCYKLYVDVVKDQANETKSPEVKKTSFFKAIVTIIIADVTMSLDNVLAVAGAAKDHYYLLIFGLILSIALMAVAANLISKWIKKYKWIAWLGLFAILIVAIELIYTDIKLFI